MSYSLRCIQRNHVEVHTVLIYITFDVDIEGGEVEVGAFLRVQVIIVAITRTIAVAGVQYAVLVREIRGLS